MTRRGGAFFWGGKAVLDGLSPILPYAVRSPPSSPGGELGKDRRSLAREALQRPKRRLLRQQQCFVFPLIIGKLPGNERQYGSLMSDDCFECRVNFEFLAVQF
jgi:hypothetical protein